MQAGQAEGMASDGGAAAARRSEGAPFESHMRLFEELANRQHGTTRAEVAGGVLASGYTIGSRAATLAQLIRESTARGQGQPTLSVAPRLRGESGLRRPYSAVPANSRPPQPSDDERPTSRDDVLADTWQAAAAAAHAAAGTPPARPCPRNRC